MRKSCSYNKIKIKCTKCGAKIYGRVMQNINTTCFKCKTKHNNEYNKKRSAFLKNNKIKKMEIELNPLEETSEKNY